MKKSHKIIYWIATGLFSAMMLIAPAGYFFAYDEAKPVFESLGFPAFIIYPLGVAKLLGVTAILTKKSAFLKEWAYAGFFFDFLLAAGGHLNAGDGEAIGAIMAMVLLIVSYIFDGIVFGNAAIKKKEVAA